MPSCVVVGCKHHSSKFSKKDGVTYHRFPHHPDRYEIWCRIIRLQRKQPCFKPQKNTRICSAHFLNNDVEYSKSGIRKLKPSAVPRVAVSNCDPRLSQQLHKLVHSQFEAKEASGEAETARGLQHVGYRCNLCRKKIFGFRYACVECANFDICTACETLAQHAAHYVLGVPTDKQRVEVEEVLRSIRNVLLKRCVYDGWEPEVKLEQPEQPWSELDPLVAPTSHDESDESSSDDSHQDILPKSEKGEDMKQSAMELPVFVTIKSELAAEGGRKASHVSAKSAPETVRTRRQAPLANKDAPSSEANRRGAGGGGAERGQGEGGFVVFTHQHTRKGPFPPNPRKRPWSRGGQELCSKLNQPCERPRNLLHQAVPTSDSQLSSNNQPSIPEQKSNEPLILVHKQEEATSLDHIPNKLNGDR